MIAPGAGVRVYLACGVTDMRKGIAGLAAHAQLALRQNPASGAVFCFRGASRPATDILHMVFAPRGSPIPGIRCSGERCRCRRSGGART